MEKDFDKWNTQKKKIDLEAENKLYTVREIWWCSLGLNIGSEQDGAGKYLHRPVLVLRGLGRETCYVAPLTTSPKVHCMRIPIGLVDGKPASVLLSQIRVVDTKRFMRKIGFLEKNIFEEVRKIAKELL